MFFWVFPRRQIVVGRRFGTLYQFHLQRLGVAFEDGTDTGFRNFGQLQFDAGEISKRTYTKDIPIHRVLVELFLSHSTSLVEFIDVQYLNKPTPFVLVEEVKSGLGRLRSDYAKR